MGASQSHFPREMKLSFDNPYKEVVYVSNKSGKGAPETTGKNTKDAPPSEAQPPVPGSPEFIAAEFEKNSTYWKDRLNRLEESHKMLTQRMLEANAQAQVEMEKILPKVPEKDAQPPCKSLLDQVMKCYQSNAQETLKCTSQVNAYKGCLGEAMGVIVGSEDVKPLPDDCQKDLILEELKKREAAKKKNKPPDKK